MFVPLRYNVRSLAQRPTRTSATVLGVAAVVAVYVVMTSVSMSMRETFGQTGQPDEALVQQAGALGMEFSALPRSAASLVRTMPQVARGSDGEPLVSDELYLVGKVPAREGTRDVSLRGVTARAFSVYRDIVLDGEGPGGGRKIAVGKALVKSLGVQRGSTLVIERETWTVVGTFSAGGSVFEQEIWLDLDELGGAARRTDLSNLLVRVADASQVQAFVDAVNNNRQEPMTALGARAAFGRVGAMNLWMASLGRFIAIIIALGAVFGGMNTMYAAVAGRTREIGVLRALGFRRPAILVSFVSESVLLGLAGGVVGCALGWVLGHLPIQSAFLASTDVEIGGPAFAWGLVLAAVVGVVGGLPPALAAARGKLVDSLR